MKCGQKMESILVQAARETGERMEERGTEVPDTDVTLSLEQTMRNVSQCLLVLSAH